MTALPVPSRLEQLEDTIERGLATFVEVGQALLEIRDEHHYRETHDTFEFYCSERWGFSRPRAYQLMQAAEVGAVVSTTVDTPIPTERIARELAPLRETPDGASVEVKTDEAFMKYGNVFFEYACLRHGEWQASGIASTHVELWVHILASHVPLVLDVPVLKRGSHPTWGACAKLLVFLAYYRQAEAELNGSMEAAA